ncbi:DUF6260 family protein [bacterium]|nr:DUF6260 family protein [bacterium]
MFIDNASVDMINNGSMGEFSEMVTGTSFDPGVLRPYINEKGRKIIDIKTGVMKNKKDKSGSIIFNKKGEPEQYEEKKAVPVDHAVLNGIHSPVFNATLALRKDEWQMLDRAVVKTARQRMRAYGDLRAANTFGGFDGFMKMILEHETMSDPGEALVDMDSLSEGRSDAPKYTLEGLPLPITHSDFFFSSRRMAISRNSGTPLDSTMAEASARRVGEAIEKTTIGTQTGMTYGTTADYGRTPTVYGYTNFTDRNTKTDMTAPDGTNGTTILTDWLALRDLLYDANMFGPYMCYVSSDYDEFLDNLFSTTEPSAGTLRSRLLQVEQFSGIRRLDFLTDTFTVIMVQMTSDVARAVNGMEPTTVQWETKGGSQLNFKVMAIQVPQLRADFSGNCGIAHGTTA